MGVKLIRGHEIFAEIRENGYYYTDKTEFIYELLRDSFKVNRITRPRRFGKTLTMSMLEDFLNISKDSRQHFEGLRVMDYPELCQEWMNQWPVLFLTMKSVEGLDFDSAIGMLRILISDCCIRHAYLCKSSKVNQEDIESFKNLLERKSTDDELKSSLYIIMRMMSAHYGKQVILLIDEYDVPLAKANENDYYREMLDVVRGMFGKALKTNEFLKFGVITGCLKIAKESIFTGLNNLVSDSISGGRYSQYIGFTEQDVDQILEDTGLTAHREKIRKWYDGYLFGSFHMYCPWDVLNHVAALQVNPDRLPGSYWENTSSNAIIRSFIDREDLWREEHINEDFEILLDGGTIVKTIIENLTYDMLHSSADNLWSLLYLTGYLTQTSEAMDYGKKELRIPNEEIRQIFRTTVMEWFKDTVKATDRDELFHALWSCDDEASSRILSGMLFKTISYHDYREDFYHAFTVGILSFAGYKVISNREQGEGRSDILLLDERNYRAIVIEMKHSDSVKAMENMCEIALKQIRDRRYAEALEDEYDEILCCGMSFFKKRCKVKLEKYL